MSACPSSSLACTPKQTGMEDSPDECLSLVFSGLHSKADRDAAALTCRRWRALDALSRHALRFSCEDQWSEMHDQLPKLLCTFPHIRAITIQGIINGIVYDDIECNEPRPGRFFTVFRHPSFAHLTTLHIEDCCGANDCFLACLALGCPALIDLSLLNTSITDMGLHFLAQGCSQLVSLNLCFCRGITDTGIDEVLKECANMKEISVSDTLYVQGWGFRNGKALMKIVAADCSMSGEFLQYGLRGATSLQILEAPFLHGEPNLAPIGKYCKLLQVLCLTASPSLDDFSITQIAWGCQDLKVLGCCLVP